jgi:hypothetical protein
MRGETRENNAGDIPNKRPRELASPGILGGTPSVVGGEESGEQAHGMARAGEWERPACGETRREMGEHARMKGEDPPMQEEYDTIR